MLPKSAISIWTLVSNWFASLQGRRTFPGTPCTRSQIAMLSWASVASSGLEFPRPGASGPIDARGGLKPDFHHCTTPNSKHGCNGVGSAREHEGGGEIEIALHSSPQGRQKCMFVYIYHDPAGNPVWGMHFYWRKANKYRCGEKSPKSTLSPMQFYVEARLLCCVGFAGCRQPSQVWNQLCCHSFSRLW